MNYLDQKFNYKQLNDTEWYNVEMFSEYLFSKRGAVYSLHLKQELRLTPNVHGYVFVNLNMDDGNKMKTALHRLMMLIFRYPKEGEFNLPVSKLHVDHLDNNRQNNSLDNLQWVTPSDNVYRSFLRGTRTNENCLVQVRNIHTNKVTTYNSYGDAGEKLGLHKTTITARCRTKGERIYDKEYQFRTVTPTTMNEPWYDVLANLGTGPLAEKMLTGKSTILVKYHAYPSIGQGEEVIREFNSLKEVCVELSRSPGFVSTHLNNPEQPMLPGLIQIKYKSDDSPWRTIDDPYLDYMRCNKDQRVVVAIHKDKKEPEIYLSTSICAIKTGCTITNLNWRLKDPQSGSKYYSNGYSYQYYEKYIKSN